MKFFWITGAALAFSALIASPSAQAQLSTFNSGTEGWMAVGDPDGPVTWSATGGNPGGHITVVDAGSGDVIFFQAPSAYLGNKASMIGGNLSFDLQQVISGGSQFDEDDVRLVSNGVTLAYDTDSNPGVRTWSSYTVPLSAGNWHVGSITGLVASNAQFASVMSNLTGLYIRAEFASFTSESDYLDNVNMAASSNVSLPVPEPETYLLLALGLVPLILSVNRRRIGSRRAS